MGVFLLEMGAEGIDLAKPVLSEGDRSVTKGAPPTYHEPEAEIPLIDPDYDYHSSYSSRRCGALGDCLGYNSPESYEDARRNTLIRRVMLVLFFQVLLVSIQCGVMLAFRDEMYDFFNEYWWTIIIIACVEIFTLLVLFCVRRIRFLNLIILVLFSLSTGFLAGVVVISYDVFTVVEAAVICLVLVGALMIYTLVTRTQVRWLGIFLTLGLFGLMMWGLIWTILALCGVYSYWLYQLYCVFGIILFIGFIVFDTSRLMSKYADPDEYILFAVNLYLDILNMFLFILQLLGGRR